EALFKTRALLRDRWSITQGLALWARVFLARPTFGNRSAVEHHYGLGDEFYFTFLDREHRLYSHGLFRSGNETLETASTAKLEQMAEALGLKAGMRILDIGAGFGGVMDFCGPRGIHVTSLTLGKDSFRYIDQLLSANRLMGTVHLEDFLAHAPSAPY